MKRKHLCIVLITGLTLITILLGSCMIKVEIEGDYVDPDRLRMTMIAEIAGESSPLLEIIVIGDEIYVKDPDIQQWMMAEDATSYSDFGGVEEFALSSVDYMLAFEGTEMLGDEAINSVPCYHIKGVVNPEKMPGAAEELGPTGSEELNVELWISKNDYLVQQMLLEVDMEDASLDAEIPMSGGLFTLTYQFSAHNKPVTIEAPELQ